MAKTADTIAIYSRKSRYTGKGESIGNQIDLCREYIRTHYGDAAAEHAVVFEDEGFSGGNLNRPDFKKIVKQRCSHFESGCKGKNFISYLPNVFGSFFFILLFQRGNSRKKQAPSRRNM